MHLLGRVCRLQWKHTRAGVSEITWYKVSLVVVILHEIGIGHSVMAHKVIIRYLPLLPFALASPSPQIPTTPTPSTHIVHNRPELIRSGPSPRSAGGRCPGSSPRTRRTDPGCSDPLLRSPRPVDPLEHPVPHPGHRFQ